MAIQCLHCSSSDGDCLAPQGFPPVLEARPAVSATRDSRTDPDHESRKPNVGSSAYSRRAFEAGERYRRNQRQKKIIRRRRPPSQTWKTFLENHVKSMVSVGLAFQVSENDNRPVCGWRLDHLFPPTPFGIVSSVVIGIPSSSSRKSFSGSVPSASVRNVAFRCATKSTSPLRFVMVFNVVTKSRSKK